mgnify:CR=1 FL=1
MATIDQWKGSRLRCVLFSGMTRAAIRRELLNMIAHAGISSERVDIDDSGFLYYPKGLNEANEYRFSMSDGLIDESKRKNLIKWWLGIDCETDKQTPNWDFVCTARIDGIDGLILVEAKAHRDELYKKDPCKAGQESRTVISTAIQLAQAGLRKDHPDIRFDMDYSYQISNRLAWGWKLASLEIPVILIYLGCLECAEMDHGSYRILRKSEDWKRLVMNYPGKKRGGSWATIPAKIWNSCIRVNDTPLFPIIASINIQPEGVIRREYAD